MRIKKEEMIFVAVKEKVEIKKEEMIFVAWKEKVEIFSNNLENSKKKLQKQTG